MSAATVVKQVFVEFKTMGTAHVSAEIAKTEEQVKRSKRSTDAAAASTTAYGKNYATAARQIASATETIARSGKVTGEAGKQIVSQATNIAFAFGAGGAAVGALGIFGLAVVQMWKRGEKAAREARQEFERAQLVLLRQGSYGAAGEQITDLLAGSLNPDASESERLGILRLREQVARTRAAQTRRALPGGGFEIVASREETARIREMEAELAKLEARYKTAQATFDELARREQARLATLKQIAADEKATNDERAAAQRALVEAEKEAMRARDDLLAEAEKFSADMEALTLKALGSADAQVAAPFDALIERARALGSVVDEGTVQQLEALRDRAVEAAAAIREADSLLARLDLAGAKGIGPVVENFTDLATQADLLFSQLLKLNPESKEYAEVQERLEKVERRRAELAKGVANAGDGGVAPTDVRTAADYAREIQQAADGALQLAQNLGGASENAIGLLRSIAQIAGNLPALQKAITAGSTLGVVGAALPILGALSGLVGDSPADRQRRLELRENTLALRKLTEQAGLLGRVDVTGGAAAGAAGDLGRFLGSGLSLFPFDARKGAAEFGLDLAELDEIAAAHGITLNKSRESFIQLQAAIADTITKLGEFGDDLESQQRQAEAEITLFGITDPRQQLAIRNRALAGRSPAFDQVLSGVDLDTAEGRAEARRRAQALFEIMRAGGERLDAGQLDGLGGDELLQALLDLVRQLDNIDESLGLNESTVGRPDRVITADRTQITADQASRMLGVQTAQLRELTIIREALVASRTGLPVPNLAAGFSSPGGGFGGITIHQTFEFHGVVPDTARIAEAATNATIEALDAALGQKLLIQRRFVGDGVSR